MVVVPGGSESSLTPVCISSYNEFCLNPISMPKFSNLLLTSGDRKFRSLCLVQDVGRQRNAQCGGFYTSSWFSWGNFTTSPPSPSFSLPRRWWCCKELGVLDASNSFAKDYTVGVSNINVSHYKLVLSPKYLCNSLLLDIILCQINEAKKHVLIVFTDWTLFLENVNL